MLCKALKRNTCDFKMVFEIWSNFLELFWKFFFGHIYLNTDTSKYSPHRDSPKYYEFNWLNLKGNETSK
jgi:hypothetical protein